MRRKQNFQTIAWFWDLYNRDRLNLDPPYQRRSVWNQAYRDYFIDTLLLEYPAPAIFLYEDITPDGRSKYHVVDGKQRLTAIFDFVNDRFPVPPNAEIGELRGAYFRDIPDQRKRAFWGYQFSVEYVPTEDETVINNVFDRINRNTAKLSNQELRHARFNGEFITAAGEFADEAIGLLGERFPNIATRSRRQMKDVELIAELMLLLEVGPRGYSSLELDEAFLVRDDEWPHKDEVLRRLRAAFTVIRRLTEGDDGQSLVRTRLRNQADFYSLVGAIDRVLVSGVLPEIDEWRQALIAFASGADSEDGRVRDRGLRLYYEAARSASNDTGPRQTRVDLVSRLLQGQLLVEPHDDNPQPDP